MKSFPVCPIFLPHVIYSPCESKVLNLVARIKGTRRCLIIYDDDKRRTSYVQYKSALCRCMASPSTIMLLKDSKSLFHSTYGLRNYFSAISRHAFVSIVICSRVYCCKSQHYACAFFLHVISMRYVMSLKKVKTNMVDIAGLLYHFGCMDITSFCCMFKQAEFSCYTSSPTASRISNSAY